jgi:hypothetical protein
MVACPEEIAYRSGYITAAQLEAWRSRCATMDTAPTCCNCCGNAFSDSGNTFSSMMKKSPPASPDFCFSNRACSATTADFFWKATTSACLPELGITRSVRAGQSFLFRKKCHPRIALPDSPAPGKTCARGHRRDSRRRARPAPQLPPSESGKFKLSGENKHILWIPRGFAHGFRVVSETAHVLYKATDFYAPEHERTVAWNDPALNIDWQRRRRRDCLGKRPDWCALSSGLKIRLAP